MVGVKLAPDMITVAVTDFCAEVLSRLSLPIRIRRQTPAVIADLVEDGVRRCVSDADLEMKDIAGICVGLPGVVASATGVCRQSPIFSERDIGFGALLTRRFGVPVTIDSDVNLVALAEHWFGQGRELNDFLVVSVERSLGLGILHKGELFRGANGLSPDLGDLMVRGPTTAGARLGDLATEDSVLAEVEGPPSGDDEGYARDRALTRAVQRAEAGEAKYVRALVGAGEALGFAIANLITLFAPPMVLICGRAIASSECFLAALRRTVAELLPPSLADVADVVVREWSEDIWVRGAAAMTLRELYGATWSTTGPGAARPSPRGGFAMKPVGVGVIGCGAISAAYLKAAKRFPILKIVALADAKPEAARARAAEFGLVARPVEALLADPKIEIILNLTVPLAHVEVGLRALAAGKHVYSEKPLGVDLDEARRLTTEAEARNLRLGCAPDTFLGGGHQTARAVIDAGQIGRPIGGTAFFMCPGHERWHPNPGFYYLRGGGPMLDMGPYYITELVNLLGPVESVVGVATRVRAERVITQRAAERRAHPCRGRHARHRRDALRRRRSGLAHVELRRRQAWPCADRDLWRDRRTDRPGPQLFRRQGARLPEPANRGAACRSQRLTRTTIIAASASPTWRRRSATRRPHRASGALALHALEVMRAFQQSSDEGRAVAIGSRPERPAPLPATLKTGELD